jgi:hypothetical protein
MAPKIVYPGKLNGYKKGVFSPLEHLYGELTNFTTTGDYDVNK